MVSKKKIKLKNSNTYIFQKLVIAWVRPNYSDWKFFSIQTDPNQVFLKEKFRTQINTSIQEKPTSVLPSLCAP